MHRYLYGVTTILILSASFAVLCYFIPSIEYSFAVNNTSNLLSSLIKQGPAKKVTSALNSITPSVNVTRLQQIPNNIAASVEKIKNIVNTTANDIRNSIRKAINDIRSALLDLGITLAVVGSLVVAAIAIFIVMRRPRLGLDKVHSPLVKTIGLVAYLIDDARVPFNLRTFEIIYKINTVLVQNKGSKAAKNCKGILNIGNEEVKVYWSAFDERDSMTINAHSVEYLDLFAIVDGEPSEIFNGLSENISKLKSYINSQTFTDTSLRQSLNANIEALSARYISAEDIPRIITQSANYGWRIPGERYYLPRREAETSRPVMVDGNIPIEMVKEISRVIVTSENARRLQEHITILEKPADVIGSAIRL
ncbi:MAG TPA: hypothetical protein VEH06_01985 [Candidatus Bathyarchaeia archaeon]|nr:hypothetical protein [Candidatus Bathyarchaeia archaeon]